MKKSLTVLLVALLSAGAVATATPQTQFNRGEFQIDLGAWSPMANISRGTGFSHSWDFAGGLTEYYDGKVQHFRENSAPLFA